MHPVYVDQDQGWAWMVLIGASLCNSICSLYSIVGVFNVIFLEVFGQSAATTAWLAGIHSALVSLTGPIASITLNRLGPRLGLIIGGLISFSGFFLTFFVSSFFMVFVSYGLIAGFGLGISFTITTTVPSLYFKKYRDTVNGLCVAGLAFGACFLCPLVRLTTAEYGWRGSMLILSGLTLQIVLGASVMRPVRWQLKEIQNIDTSKELKSEVQSSQADINQKKYVSMENCHSSIINDTKCHLTLNGNNRVRNTKSLSNLFYGSKNDLKHDSYISPQFASTPHLVSDRASNVDVIDDCTEVSDICLEENYENKTRETKKSFDFSIFKSTFFLIYCASTVLCNIALAIFFTFLPMMSMHYGTEALAAGNLIAWSSTVSVFARIAIGMTSNFSGIHIYLLNSGLAFFSGIILIAAPWLGIWYSGQLVVSLIMGIIGMGVYVLLPGTCIAILGFSKVSSSMGTISFMCGIGYLIGPPLGGLFYDLSHGFFYTFVTAGCCYIAGAILSGYLYICVKLSKHQANVNN